MQNIKVLILMISTSLVFLFPMQQANAQAEPDYDSAVNLLNVFEKQCFGKFPDFEAIRNEAHANGWLVGPLHHGQEVSWAVNEGTDNFSLMLVDNPSDSSKTCEVRGKASEDTTVSVFNGLYQEKLSAQRTGAPESSWTTLNGLVTIQQSDDGRTSVILAK